MSLRFSENFFEPAQLRQAQRGAHVAHRRLIGRAGAHHDRRSLARSMRAEASHRHRDVDVVGDHHAAFAADQRPGLREIEYRGVAEGADQRSLVFGANCFGGVFEQDEPMLIGDFAQLRPLRRMAVGVARHDRARFVGDQRLDLSGRDDARPIVDVGEHRLGAGKRDRMHGFAEGMRRGDHFIARTDLIRGEREQQPHRAAWRSHGVFAPEIVGEGGFERLRHRAAGQAAGAQHRLDRGNVVERDVGVGKRNEIAAEGLSGRRRLRFECIVHFDPRVHRILPRKATMTPVARAGSSVTVTQ